MGEFDPRDRNDARDFPKSLVGGKWTYYQPRLGTRLRLMARSGGYVMVRPKGAMPMVLTEKEWAKLPLWSANPTTGDRDG